MRSAPSDVSEGSATRIIRSRARTFYLASLFLPRPIRGDVHEMYAYYRRVDDLVDDPAPGATRQTLLNQLANWKAQLHGELPASAAHVSGALRVAQRYQVPVTYLDMVLEGARRDLECCRVETIDDLLGYSVLVAGSVGMSIACVLGASSKAALAAASDLGVAMQITNILRDVGEDLELNRIYLPSSEMGRHRCTPAMLVAGQVTPQFRALMSDLIELAREHYARGTRGVRYLPPRMQYSVFLAAVLYADILRKIERHDYDVFSHRAHLGLTEKWARALPAYMSCRRVRN